MVLYHASTLKNLEVITPQHTLSHDTYIGDYVFATKNKNLALMYLVPKGFPTLMNPDGPKPNIVICAKQEDYLKQDKGGAIYELSSEGFKETPQRGLTDYEMASNQPLEPLRKTVHSRALDALLSANITVRFVDKETFDHLIQHTHQTEMIEKIEPAV